MTATASAPNSANVAWRELCCRSARSYGPPTNPMFEHHGIADGAIGDMEAQRLRRDLFGDRARHDARANLQAQIIKRGVRGDALRQLAGGEEILPRLPDPRRHEIADGADDQHRTKC